MGCEVVAFFGVIKGCLGVESIHEVCEQGM